MDEFHNNCPSEIDKNLYRLTEEKIKFGENLKNYIDQTYVDGLQKLSRKVNQELKFLRKVYKSKVLKKEHLQCSNLTHFSALVDTLKSIKNCQSVNKTLTLEKRKIVIDLICENGLKWIKVIARNPKSLSQIYMGNGSYGAKTIVDQAEEYVACANLYPCLFQTPKIVFVFINGIGKYLANKLEGMGILVEGDRTETNDIIQIDFEGNRSESETDTSSIISSFSELSTLNLSSIRRVNLDVSSMLAYCCSVVNGGAFLYDFDVPVLKQQAEWERQRPVKPILDDFFHNKKLFCCQTAKESFESIVNTVGGPNERIRSKEFLNRITVLPDETQYKDIGEDDENNHFFNQVQLSSEKTLKIGGKIRQRSLKIFLFGDRIHAITVTSNDGFVRSARQQNINFVVFVHESRALTEQKEITKAKPFKKEAEVAII